VLLRQRPELLLHPLPELPGLQRRQLLEQLQARQRTLGSTPALRLPKPRT
jgi:hypothetical protein